MSTQHDKVITVKGVDFVIGNEGYHIENPPQWLFEHEKAILANVERAVELAEMAISTMVMTIGLISFGLISEWGSDRAFWDANLKMDEETFLTNMSNTYNNALQMIMETGEDTEDDDQENGNFYREMIADILNLAQISVEPDDVVEVDDFDPDRLYFTLANGDSSFFLRLWNMNSAGVEYTLYKENDADSADAILNGFYRFDVSSDS